MEACESHCHSSQVFVVDADEKSSKQKEKMQMFSFKSEAFVTQSPTHLQSVYKVSIFLCIVRKIIL
jgi:hypothetical protein